MGKNSPQVYLVVPVFNRLEKTLQFLKSTKKSNYKNITVIVVDDGSTDGTYETITSKYPDVVLLQGDGNLWWAGATNMGVEYALQNGRDQDYVYTINNDTELASDTLLYLVESAIKHPKSLIGTVIYDTHDHAKSWYYGAYFDRANGRVEHYHGKLPIGERLRESEWLTGMGALIPFGVFKNIGIYDSKKYPQYFGDMELGLRAKRVGYKLYVDTKAVAYADLETAWINSSVDKKPWSFVWQLFTSTKSPFKLTPRYFLYKEYWGRGWITAYMKSNLYAMRHIMMPFIKHKIKNAGGKK